MPSMAASLSAQGFSHTHAYCALCARPSQVTSLPQKHLRVQPGYRMTREKVARVAPKGSDGKHLDRDGTDFCPLEFPMTFIYR